MTWGTAGNVSTTNLDSDSDSPAAARPDIKAAFDELKNVINGKGAANGVAPLNSSSKIDATYIGDELNSSSSTDLTLDPATNIVVIEDIVKLNPRTKSQLNAQANLADGMVAFCSDATADSASNAGAPCYYHDGFWRRFSDDTTI
jgi:hypothetical protein